MTIGEFATIQYGVSKAAAADGNIPILGMQHISNGQITGIPEQRVFLTSEERERFLVRPGDLLLNRTNSRALVGKCAVVPANIGECTFASYLVRLHVDSKKADSEYLAYAMNSPTGRARLRALATPGVSQYNINPTTLSRHYTLALPPLPEQQKLAGTLRLWDRAIICVGRLLAVKRRFKRGLMQQLLTGKRRFKEFEGDEWRPRPLKDFLIESRVPASDGRHARRVTVRLYGKGVVASDERRPGSASTRYYRRSAGQFVYSKLDFLNGACGVIPPELDGFETTLDLPAFDVSPQLDVRWLVALVSQAWFYRRHVGLALGGRKAKRLNPVALLGIQVPIPLVDEQRAIATVLTVLDRELSLLEQLRDALDRQRRGVMELLLTGKVRVPA